MLQPNVLPSKFFHEGIETRSAPCFADVLLPSEKRAYRLGCQGLRVEALRVSGDSADAEARKESVWESFANVAPKAGPIDRCRPPLIIRIDIYSIRGCGRVWTM